MPDEVERRRVAQALREMETPTWPTLTEAVMGHVATRDKVVWRLAELIEPAVGAVSAFEIDGDGGTGWEFSLSCGHEFDWSWREPPAYCPVCGARIRGEDE